MKNQANNPMYFVHGKLMPSKANFGKYFSTIIRLSNMGRSGEMVTATFPDILKQNNTYSFGPSCYSTDEVLNSPEFIPVDVQEWDAAVRLLKQDIDRI